MIKYERIANDMKEKIENGIYKPNDQLPFEAEMCEAYGVSRITVKKAMDLLVNEGLVVKRRGAGTFVKNIPLMTDTDHPYSTSNQFSGFAHMEGHTNVTSMVHDFQVIPATKEIASHLKIEEVEQIVFLDDGRIFEYSKSRHRGDRFELHTVSVQ